jgi:hypothetical protein
MGACEFEKSMIECSRVMLTGAPAKERAMAAMAVAWGRVQELAKLAEDGVLDWDQVEIDQADWLREYERAWEDDNHIICEETMET